MSNIYGYNDLERNNNRSRGNQPQEENFQNATDCKSKCKAILNHLFPNFSLKSFSFISILVIILMYVLEIVIYHTSMSGSKDPNRSNGEWTCTMYRLGGFYTPAVVLDKHLYRLFTPMLLHGNFSHLFNNMLSMLFISFYIESVLGAKKLIFLFVVCGVFGGVLSGVIDQEAINVGASGAIFGMYGFLILYFIFNYKVMKDHHRRLYCYFMMIFIFSFVGSFDTYKDSNVAIFAHIGGLICGLLLGYYYIELSDNPLMLQDSTLSVLKLLQKVSLVVISIGFISLLVYLFLGLETKANNLQQLCDYLAKNPK